MPGPEKRLPGQSDADYGRPAHDPNADFRAAFSVEHGGGNELGLARRLVDAVAALVERVRRR